MVRARVCAAAFATAAGDALTSATDCDVLAHARLISFKRGRRRPCSAACVPRSRAAGPPAPKGAERSAMRAAPQLGGAARLCMYPQQRRERPCKKEGGRAHGRPRIRTEKTATFERTKRCNTISIARAILSPNDIHQAKTISRQARRAQRARPPPPPPRSPQAARRAGLGPKRMSGPARGSPLGETRHAGRAVRPRTA